MSDQKTEERGGASAHGAALGKALARLDALGRAANPELELDEKCATCAFREGSFPNMCAATTRDAINSLAGNNDGFVCHHGMIDGEPTRYCDGFMAAMECSNTQISSELMVALDEIGKLTKIDKDEIADRYWAFIARIDPEDKLDDYQRARAWAREVA